MPRWGFQLTRGDVECWIAAHASPPGDSAAAATVIVEREELHALVLGAGKNW